MSEPITSTELAEWRAAREKASPGPWYHNPNSPMFVGTTNTITRHSADNPNPLFQVGRDTEGGGYPFRVTETKAALNAAFIALAANNWIGLLDEITRLQAECDRLRKLARELTLLAVEAGEAYKSLHFKWLVNNSALWLAADALHRNDTPRDTETDDVQEWRQQAEDSERTREENDANTIPIILELIRVKLARPDVVALGEEIDG